MSKVLHIKLEDDKEDYLEGNLRLLKRTKFFQARIKKRNFLLLLYSFFLILGITFTLYTGFHYYQIIFFLSLSYLLYQEYYLEKNWLSKANQVYSEELNFDKKITEYSLSKESIESKTDFQTLKFDWSELTNLTENLDEIELNFGNKGFFILRKKSFINKADYLLISDFLKSMFKK